MDKLHMALTELSYSGKVEKNLTGSLDSIPSPSVKIQIMGRKVCCRCKSKTLLGVVNNFLKTKKGKGDGIKYRLSSLIFSTL